MTIWFYDHPYPPGYKSYSKTKPLLFEEFRAAQQWWGAEDDNFADREPNERAWKIDFKTKREQAEAAAQPYWQRAEELKNKARSLDDDARELKATLNGKADGARRAKFATQIDELRKQAEEFRQQSRDSQVAGDRLYWPIYNLDLKNPNGPSEESRDADVLLERYTKVLGELEETQNQLKSELAAALIRHFAGKEV